MRPYSGRRLALVVDDCPHMQRYLRMLLELQACEVEIAGNGEDAIRRVEEGCAPAIVLLDVEMPGIGGLKTLRHLRRLRPDLKVIMCSGVDDPRVIRDATELGAEAYITKPVHHLYLSAALERCLASSTPRGETQEKRRTNLVTMPAPSV
ncbi:MAG TPA: response regulator [Terriglobales bacterium]